MSGYEIGLSVVDALRGIESTPTGVDIAYGYAGGYLDALHDLGVIDDEEMDLLTAGKDEAKRQALSRI